jgi:Flp pilus assembly protein TadD/peroxiredoxin
MRGRRTFLALLLILPPTTPPAPAAAPPASDAQTHHHLRLRPPASLEPILRHVAPGSDAFPEEKTAQELGRRLEAFGAKLCASPQDVGEALAGLLAPEFREGRVTPGAERPVTTGGLEVARAAAAGEALARDAFVRDFAALLDGLDRIAVAELLITELRVEPGAGEAARTLVRYDLVGSGRDAWRAQRVGRWRLVWQRGPDGVFRVVEWTAEGQVRSRAPAPVFAEATEAALGKNPSFRRQLALGLDPWLATLDSVFMLDSMGHHGVSAGDADGDGRDDLYVAQPAGLPNRLFRNRGDGTFEDVTEAAGLAVLDDTAQSLFLDVDNDGDQDLALVTRAGLLLFANDGQGRYAAVPGAFTFTGALRGSPMAIAAADYDRDGFLDLYLCTYSYFLGAGEDKGGSPNPYHDATNGPPNVLFRNDGRGRFVDVTAEAGLDAGNDRFSFAAAWGDYDEDGWIDLLVANDFGRKNLYRNEGRKDGRVRFREVTAAAGVEDHGAGMSAAFLDYDGDGRLDLYTGNMWSAAGQRVTASSAFMPEAPAEARALYARHARGNSLFRNRGDGAFEDVSLAAGAEMGRWAWAADAFDFDRDGFLDLHVVNGMFTRESPDAAPAEDLDGFFWRQVVARSPLRRVAGTAYDEAWRAVNRLLAGGSQASHQRNVVLRNDGAGRFDDVSGTLGLDLDQDGRSFAVLDYDGDGDPDLAVLAARSAPQLRLFRNDLVNANRALAVRLVGTKSNRDAVGARVTVETDRRRLVRVVQAGSGFISQHAKELLFGVGGSERVERVTIAWPSGHVQRLDGVPPNVRLHVSEGGEVRSERLHAGAREASVPPAAPGPTPAPPPAASWLYEPFPAPDFTLRGADGGRHTLSALRGKPAVLLFWSAASPAARDALEALHRGRAALAAAGASLLAVALDTPEAEMAAAARRLPGLPLARGDQEAATAFALLNRYLFVTKEDLRIPTAFLLDAQGEIVRAYRGAIEPERIAEDVARTPAPAAERLARAMPFPGRFYGVPGRRNYLQYALELVEQGMESSALGAFERAAKGDPSAFTLYSLGTLYMKRGDQRKAEAAFARALEVKPDFSEASNGLGAILAQGGNLPAAVARFRVALETTPDYPDALNNLGYALLQMGRNREAHDLYQKALALQPDFPEAFNNLGIYHAREGDPPRAESSFRQAVERRPGYGEAGNNLALVLMARGDAAGAVAVLERLKKENPAFEATYLTLARIHLSLERRREAAAALEQLLQRNPTHPQALELMRELRSAR